MSEAARQGYPGSYSHSHPPTPPPPLTLMSIRMASLMATLMASPHGRYHGNPHVQAAGEPGYPGGHAGGMHGYDHDRRGHVTREGPHGREAVYSKNTADHGHVSLASDPTFPHFAMITEGLDQPEAEGQGLGQQRPRPRPARPHACSLRITGIDDIRQVRQRHIAQFADTLLIDMPRNYGRSRRDLDRPMREIIAMARLLPESERGLNGATINRHLTALHGIFHFAKARGMLPAEAGFTHRIAGPEIETRS